MDDISCNLQFGDITDISKFQEGVSAQSYICKLAVIFMYSKVVHTLSSTDLIVGLHYTTLVEIIQAIG